MLNSFRNSVKYLRSAHINAPLNILKDGNLSYVVKTSERKFDVSSKSCIYNTNLQSSVISLTPRNVGIQIGYGPSEGKTKQDPLSYIPIINPRSILPLVDGNWRKDEVGLPSPQNEEKHAVRLIVIRRKKMKKHQRRKLWKRMRFRWARIKKRRRQRKEKAFQNELLALVQDANEFSAERYVSEKLQRACHTPLPTRWRHKRLPAFIIRQLLGIDKKINYKHTDVYKA